MSGYIGSSAVVVSNGAERKKTYAITGTTTSLTGLNYTVSQVHVFHNGVRLVDGTDFTATNGNSITLTTAAEDGDEVVVISYATYQTSDTVSASVGGTFSGDIEIDGDLTVDTDTLYVDSTNNRVGVGTSSPSTLMHLSGTGEVIRIEDTDATLAADQTIGKLEFYSNDASGAGVGVKASVKAISEDTIGRTSLMFSTADDTSNDQEAMRIDSSGNVGIGTSSPSGAKLQVTGSNFDEQLVIERTDTSSKWSLAGNTSGGFQIYDVNSANATRLVIDSSGNLLVGKTSTAYTTVGCELQQNGSAWFVRDQGAPLFANRTTNDGVIANFAKDGTTVGSVGTNSLSRPYITGQSGVVFFTSALLPAASTGEQIDNNKDLGAATVRWDDVYATNGTIQTSDQNEKQQIASLTDAEITAAKAISKLFKTFKWNDSVTEKGDAARTHAGVIAQDVEQAMTDAGLNAGDYAFFISTTWWETQTDVPAVEAVEAVDATYDEDGNVLTEAVEAVEAQEAYTRTDTYETAGEAPEGATERNRKGIRYPELLSFIGAATEQRLASIETRLDALEAN